MDIGKNELIPIKNIMNRLKNTILVRNQHEKLCVKWEIGTKQIGIDFELERQQHRVFTEFFVVVQCTDKRFDVTQLSARVRENRVGGLCRRVKFVLLSNIFVFQRFSTYLQLFEPR